MKVGCVGSDPTILTATNFPMVSVRVLCLRQPLNGNRVMVRDHKALASKSDICQTNMTAWEHISGRGKKMEACNQEVGWWAKFEGNLAGPMSVS